ncbi:FMN-dependent NADH-azoreductase [Agrobacterium larrymoorei]|uniref:FMN-dependent NADH-azoreductase n=1 Tax=Agrobacterium larrymoorei TaxID=160699 RepID=UPI0015746563|nr:NAD(P)H-dependent oxidoreductase [Agrobacterium larrymoorei]NTJ44686.1 FMN-dependent NADH-azoreductase [Agrobacterium larrymoorei]
MNILHIDSSISGVTSVSRTLSKETVARLVSIHPYAKVSHRDLVLDPPSHFVGADDAISGQTLLQEFLDADVVVIGVAFYNLSIPSQLKAWIDRIIVSGKTFRYGEAGAEGLVGDKRVVIALARGGKYRSEGSLAASEHAETYLKSIFQFIGVIDIDVIVAEGISMGEGEREAATQSALNQIANLS